MSESFYRFTLKKRRKGQTMTAKQRLEAQSAFLEAYEKTANILRAAEQAEISREIVYYWLEHDEQFLMVFNLADKAANAHIEAEIRRRAIEGWEEPLVSAGKRLGTVRKYSDTLLIFYAKRRMPEYRDKQPDITINNVTQERNAVYANMRDDELDQLESLWHKAQERIGRGGH